jgi:hypothetical protein
MTKANSTFFATFFAGVTTAVMMLLFQTQTTAQCALVCNDFIQVSLDEDCTTEILPDMVLEGPNLCPNGNLQVQMRINNVWVPAVANSNHLNQTIQIRVRDQNSGNSCSGFMFVEDKLAPELTCQDLVLSCAVTNFTPAYLDDELGFANAFPTVDENCGSFTLNFADTWNNLGCGANFNGQTNLSGYVKRVWTATDPSGNQETCTQYLYLKRRHVSAVKFPSDVTVSCSAPDTDPSSTGTPFISEFGKQFSLFPQNTYCELQTAYTDQILTVCDGSYKILRTWTVYDECLPTGQFPPNQNPVYFVQVIKVQDVTGPVVVDCPDDLTSNTNPFDCEADVNLPDVIVSDVCSRIASIRAEYTVDGVTYIVNGTLQDFPGNNKWNPDTLGVLGFANNLPLGDHLIRYIVTDDCGNSTVCSFELTVEDQTQPAAICDEFTQVSLGFNGEIFVNATTFDDGSYDNCADVFFKVRRLDSNGCQPNNRFYDQVKFCCDDVTDTVTVILRVYDVPVPAGEVSLTAQEDHANDCQVQVFVDDKIKPTCLAPANTTVSCENFDPSLWAYGMPSATDNCCVDTITTTVNFALFDTLCNRGTITRTFRAFDCAGQSSTCTQRIVVNYEQDYFLRLPNDVIVTNCDGTGNYGEPTFFGEDCELLAVSFTDEVFTVVPDACYKIERTWRIINWCTYNPNSPVTTIPNPNPNVIANHPSNLTGPIVSACGTTGPWAPTTIAINPGQGQTNYCTFWNANANGYSYKQIIKVIDGKAPVFTNCPASPVTINDLTPNDPLLWNQMYWWDSAISSHDLCEAPVDLSITVTDSCSLNDVTIKYLLFLDLDGNGTMETVVSSTNIPPANTVFFNNGFNPNFSGGEARNFDGRPVPVNQKYRFNIDWTDNGNSRTAKVVWDTPQTPAQLPPANNTVQGVNPELPYGTHKIKWIVNDKCGNESVCEYTFIVKDGKAPTVVCLNGLSVNISPTGIITLWASDFLQYTEDNCTPAGQINIGIVESDESTGSFPVDAQGNPITNVTFDCFEVGTQPVQLWGRDVAGNADFCETYIIVQDPNSFCNPGQNASVAGAAKIDFTNQNSGLQDASVQVSGQTPNGLPPINFFVNTSNQGKYNFAALPLAGNYVVTPQKDDNHLNGVTTFDLVLISKHILGLDPLSTPYKMIAADANKSNSITTFDIVELRKLILGIYTEFPNNTSWRFVKKDFNFADPNNPFANQFPENIDIQSLQQGGVDAADFIAVKIGDVNTSAIPNALVNGDDRSAGTMYFDINDLTVAAGEEFVVNFKGADPMAGYQLTMNLNGLDVAEILPGANMGLDNFAVFAADKAVTMSVNDNAGEFAVKFRATKAGQLSQMLAAGSRITAAEAYNEQGERFDVAFRFNGRNGSVIAGAGFELLQNTPNPVAATTNIAFNLPEAAKATLTISNTEGRILKVIKGEFSKGLNTITLNRSELESGVLFYQLDTPTNSGVKKMIVVD